MRHQKIELLAFVINSDEYLLSVASADGNGGEEREAEKLRARKRERGGRGKERLRGLLGDERTPKSLAARCRDLPLRTVECEDSKNPGNF